MLPYNGSASCQFGMFCILKLSSQWLLAVVGLFCYKSCNGVHHSSFSTFFNLQLVEYRFSLTFHEDILLYNVSNNM